MQRQAEHATLFNFLAPDLDHKFLELARGPRNRHDRTGVAVGGGVGIGVFVLLIVLVDNILVRVSGKMREGRGGRCVCANRCARYTL